MTNLNITEEDAKWLAGFIEGEGYFGFWNAKTRWTKKPTKYVQLGVTHTDEKIMKELSRMFGRKYHRRTRKKEWGENIENCKPAWRITVTNRKAYLILKKIAPYMRGERKDKAMKIIREYEEMKSK